MVDLARNPSLHEGDVLVSRNLNGLSVGVQPCERVVSVRGQS